MAYKLFLDDYRNPKDCVSYMHKFLGSKNVMYLEKDWIICKDMPSFIKTITTRGIPDVVSFDHDLRDEHYMVPFGAWETDPSVMQQFDDTGYDCAVWLINYCATNKKKYPFMVIHSANKAGRHRIANVIMSIV